MNSLRALIFTLVFSLTFPHVGYAGKVLPHDLMITSLPSDAPSPAYFGKKYIKILPMHNTAVPEDQLQINDFYKYFSVCTQTKDKEWNVTEKCDYLKTEKLSYISFNQEQLAKFEKSFKTSKFASDYSGYMLMKVKKYWITLSVLIAAFFAYKIFKKNKTSCEGQITGKNKTDPSDSLGAKIALATFFSPWLLMILTLILATLSFTASWMIADWHHYAIEKPGLTYTEYFFEDIFNAKHTKDLPISLAGKMKEEFTSLLNTPDGKPMSFYNTVYIYGNSEEGQSQLEEFIEILQNLSDQTLNN